MHQDAAAVGVDRAAIGVPPNFTGAENRFPRNDRRDEDRQGEDNGVEASDLHN
jgi:hypothetical protein